MTILEWEIYFSSLSGERRKQLFLALQTLKDDDTIKKHFNGFGIFALISILSNVDRDLRELTYKI
jgi:hypothetical protein